MQILYTIEVRVDFRDESKLDTMKVIVQQAARHVFAQSALLGDSIKPQIVIYGHDYFTGHADIPLFDDDIAAGMVAITEAGNPGKPAELTTGGVAPVTVAAGGAETIEGFSPELLTALK